MKTFGIVLIVVGLVMLLITGFTYTTQETVIDAGPLEVTAEQEETVNWPPYVGGIALVTGIVILLMGRNRT